MIRLRNTIKIVKLKQAKFELVSLCTDGQSVGSQSPMTCHGKTNGFLSMGFRKPRKTYGFLSVVLRKPRKTYGFLSMGVRKPRKTHGFLSVVLRKPYRTIPYRTVPYHTAPHRTVRYRTVSMAQRDPPLPGSKKTKELFQDAVFPKNLNLSPKS